MPLVVTRDSRSNFPGAAGGSMFEAVLTAVVRLASAGRPASAARRPTSENPAALQGLRYVDHKLTSIFHKRICHLSEKDISKIVHAMSLKIIPVSQTL